MEIVNTRDTFTPRSTTGRLSVDGEDIGYVLEPTLNPTAKPHAIPEGRYEATIYQSPRLGYRVLLLHDVPGFSMIEMHIGNWPKDTLGCQLPGLTRGVDVVGNSAVAFHKIMMLVDAAIGRGEEVWYTVQSAPGVSSAA
jgi:hypothetical protein